MQLLSVDDLTRTTGGTLTDTAPVSDEPPPPPAAPPRFPVGGPRGDWNDRRRPDWNDRLPTWADSDWKPSRQDKRR